MENKEYQEPSKEELKKKLTHIQPLKKGFDIMKKIIIVYKSKYGSTKKYAEWIKMQLMEICMSSQKLRLRIYCHMT